MLKTGRFSRKERIKRPDEIRNLFKYGTKVSVSGAKLFFAQNGQVTNRIGFPLSRNYGNAVCRNHSKRLSREAYRFYKLRLNTGYDMLLLIYPGNDSFNTRCNQIRTLFNKSGLLRG